MKNFKIKLFSILLASAMILSACATTETTENTVNDTSAISGENLNVQQDDITIGTSSTTNIFLNGDTAKCDNSNVDIENSVITIKSAGTYTITGTLNDGQIVVDCTKNEKVELILNNVDITCSTSSPINVLSVDKVIINLADGSTNTINDIRDTKNDTSNTTDIPNGAIYSKDDLTIKGNGSLNVTGNYNNGISTKNDLKVTGGNITITAVNNALKGNDSVTIKDGTFNLTCDGDGIKTDNIEETEKGYIYIENGNFTINSQGDCLNSDNYTTILNGNFDLTSANGYTNASVNTGSDMSMGKGFNKNNGERKFNFNSENAPVTNEDGSMPDMENFNPEDRKFPENVDGSMPNMENFNSQDIQTQDDNSSSDISAKGIKSNGDLTIENGTFNINSQDDALHCNASIIINNGTFIINAGNDGIHADYDCTINNGTIDIQNSYEGIEGANIYINNGTINVISTDDGLNGSDKTTTSTNGFGSSTGYVEFNGGYTYVKAQGDGIDSNGDMVFNDGTIIVEGPTNNGNGSLDCGDNQNTIVINGGTLLTCGTSGMFEIPDSTSTQNYIYSLSLSANANSVIVIADEDNNIICAIKLSQEAQSIMFSSSNIENGKTYHIYKDVEYTGTFDKNGFATGGTFSNGTDIGSVEITDIINQIGTGNINSFNFGGGNRHENFNKAN